MPMCGSGRRLQLASYAGRVVHGGGLSTFFWRLQRLRKNVATGRRAKLECHLVCLSQKDPHIEISRGHVLLALPASTFNLRSAQV